MNQIIKQLRSLSILKTFRFNLHYFGLNGLRCPVLVYRHCVFAHLGGAVKVSSYNKTGIVKLFPKIVGIKDERYERGLWDNKGLIEFEEHCIIGAGSKISCQKNAQLTFGDGFCANGTCEMICADKILFDKHTLVSWDCLFMDTDFHRIKNQDGKRKAEHEPIHIGEHCWIGCRSVILKGVNLPNDTVIAANSTITRKYTLSNTVIGTTGILKEKIEWEK